MADVRSALRREVQLDAISTILVLALLTTLGLLFYFLSSSGVQLPGDSPIAQYAPRVLLGGFTILLLLYLSDQRRRLRVRVAEAAAEANEAVASAEAARNDLADTVRWLTFSHEAASVLGAEGVDGGLLHVLTQAAELFDADAAAVIDEDIEDAFIAPDVSQQDAERALMQVALEAAGKPEPLLIQSLGTMRGEAIAVPLRVLGELRFVLCVWRRREPFLPQQLASLGLMGRMVELAIEREELLAEGQSQLEGTLNVLQYLVADKRPNYSQHAMRVADLASEVGRRVGLTPKERKSLKLAGLIHDVGIMSMPRDMADANRPLTAEEHLVMRQHPRIGAEIALAAHFDDSVQQAVAGHHERFDGSGYPRGFSGEQIPMTARILAVCEVYDSMSNRAYHGNPSSRDEAVAELQDYSGVLYDASVVKALVEGLPVHDVPTLASPEIAEPELFLVLDDES